MTHLLLMLCLIFGCVSIQSNGVVPTDPKTLKVLTINLCADWKASRQERADKIVSFVQNEKIDLILTQEGIRGVGQFDAVKYIAGKIGYSYAQSPAFGVPGFFEYCVGIISATPLSNVQSVGCQVPGGDPIDQVPFPGAGRGILATVGTLRVLSSHMMAPVSQGNRENQVRCLADSAPMIWGGDFNFNRDNVAYALIGLPEAAYPGDSQVDMIFGSLPVIESKAVFTDHYVSDHGGILTTFKRN